MREKRKGRKLISRIFAGLICAVLVATLLPGLPGGQSRAAEPFPSGTAPESAEFWVADSTVTGGYRKIGDSETPVIDNTTTTFLIRYSWGTKQLKDLGDTTDGGNKPDGLKLNTPYILPALETDGNIALRGLGSSVPVYGTPGDSSTQFATIDYTNNTISFTSFELGQAYFGFECTIDADSSKADEDGKVDIKIPGGKTFKVQVNSLKPAEPTLSKTKGTFNAADGTVEWTVTYTDPEKKYPNGITNITDTLPDGMEFVSFSAGSSGVSCAATAGTTGEITFTLPAESTTPAQWLDSPNMKTHTFTYKTKLTDAKKVALLNGTGGNFINVAKLNGTEGGTPKVLKTGDATLNIPNNTAPAIKKTASSYNPATQSISWTIEVNTLGLTPDKTFKITDTLGSKLLVDDSTNKITATISGTGSTTQDITANPFEINLKGVTPAANGKITVTYATKVDQAIFSGGSASDIENNATLDIEFNDSSKGTVKKSTGGIGPGGFTTNYITKERDNNGEFLNYGASAATYNTPEAGITPYKVTLNPNGLPVSGEVWFTDVLTYKYNKDSLAADKLDKVAYPSSYGTGDWGICVYGDETAVKKILTDAGLTIDDASFRWLDSSKAQKTSAELSNEADRKGFTVKITGGLDNTPRTIKLLAKLSDPNYIFTVHGGGTNLAPWNGATLTIGSNIYGDSAPWEYGQTKDNLFKKFLSSYDPVKHEMEWKIGISRYRGISIGEFTVEDTMAEGLSYIDGSASYEGGLLAGTGGVSVNEQKITFNLKTDTNAASRGEAEDSGFILKYKTKVDFTKIPADNKYLDKDLSLENKAVLNFPDSFGIPSIESKVSPVLPGKGVLNKGGKMNADPPTDNIITYTVEINPYTLTIPKNTASTELFVEDKLGEGILLDEDSIMLYEAETKATVNNGAVTVKVDKKGVGTKQSLTTPNSYDFPKRTFKIKLPPDADKKPYILEYKAYATKPGALDNQITITGSAIPIDFEKNEAVVTYSAAAYGGALKYVPSTGGYNIKVTKKKLGTNEVIKYTGSSTESRGAEFEIFVGTNTKVGTATTSEVDGVAEFYIPQSYVNTLPAGTKLYIRETKAPQGYAISNKLLTITVEELKAAGTGSANALGRDFFDDTNEIPKDPGDPDLADGGTGGTTPPPGSGTIPPGNGTTPPAGGGTGGGGGFTSGGGGSTSSPSVTGPGPALTTKPADTAPEAPALTPDGTPTVEGASEAPAAPAVTVTFQSELGNIPAPQTMTPGQVAYNPGAPLDPASLQPGMVINGQRFEGWYTDPEFKNAYKFGTPVTEDMVLYAKWTKVGVAGKSPKTADNNWVLFILAGSVAVLLAGGIRLIKSRSKDN